MNSKQRKTERLAPWLLLFGVPFLCVGLGTLTFACLRWHTFFRARSWQPVAATIQQADLQEHPGSEGTTYSVEATYTYESKGRRYTSNRVDITGLSSGDQPFHWRRYQELKRHRDTGLPFTAYVNPQNPSESVLYRQADTSIYENLAIGAFGACVLCLAAWAIRKWNRIRTLSECDKSRLLLVRADWRQGCVRASMARYLLPSCIAAVGMIAVVSIFIIPWASAGAPVLAWLAIGLFLLIAALAVFRAAQRLATLLVYGTPVLYLSEVPVVPGRRVVAALRTARPLAADRWTLSLECFAWASSEGSGEDPRLTEVRRRLQAMPGRRPTVSGTTWYGQRVYCQEPSPLGDARSDHTGALMLPVALELPKGTPETALDPYFRITWALSAKARAFPLSFSASFELPVFAVPEDAIQKMDDAHR